MFLLLLHMRLFPVLLLSQLMLRVKRLPEQCQDLQLLMSSLQPLSRLHLSLLQRVSSYSLSIYLYSFFGVCVCVWLACRKIGTSYVYSCSSDY